MRETEIPVTFQPGDKTVFVLENTCLLEAAAAVGFVVNAPCGGEAICGKCRIVVVEGADEPTSDEIRMFSADEIRAGCRLACRSMVHRPMTVLIPQTAVVGSRHQILVESGTTVVPDGPPILEKHYVELPPPVRGDDLPDTARLEKLVGPFEADLDLFRALPRRLREAGFRGTAVLAEGRLLDFEPGNTEWHAHGVAVDLGTTTLVASLVDLATGRQTAVVSQLNPQTRFGDDVLSRILCARDRPDGLQQIQRAVVEAVDAMIGQLCVEAGIAREQIYLVSGSGNTTMQQLFCGIETTPLGEVPFVPAIGRGMSLPAGRLGLHVHPQAAAHLMPVIGGFVGGDTVAGILATGLADCSRPTLLVDIGTNGEIVLQSGTRLTAASTAAGPAFEGARISQGMRASTGAIEKVVVADGRLKIQVIGNVAPVGLCGSALIDAAAELLRHGILASQGRLLPPDELPPDVLPDLARRVVLHGRHPAFVLADEESTGAGPVLLTQRDIRELQLATGAIRAGITILLQRERLRPEDLDAVLLAGGFGNFVRRSSAQRIGLLPPGIEHRRIRYVGNTSLAGARLVVASRQARRQVETLAERTEHVDLSMDLDFQAVFADSMIFPDS